MNERERVDKRGWLMLLVLLGLPFLVRTTDSASGLGERRAAIMSADTVEVLTSQTCVRADTTEKSTACYHGFGASIQSGRKFVLIIENGNPDGTQRASGAGVWI